MLKTDKTLLFPISTGASAGGYVGIFPPSLISNSAMQNTHITDLLWAVLTAVVVTTVSFFVTLLLKRVFKARTTRSN